MSQSLGQSRGYEMAVGSSNMLESPLMTGETLYSAMETTGDDQSWSKTEAIALCRLCANTNDYLIPIYDGQGLEYKLEGKIHKYLPIQVSQTDTLPLVVCYQCASTVISYDTIYTNCFEAEKKLRSLIEEASSASKAVPTEISTLEGDKSQLEVEETMLFDDAPANDDDSDDEPLISKAKVAPEKAKSTPIKKKILSKTKKKTTEGDKTAETAEEDGKEREGKSKGVEMLGADDINEILSVKIEEEEEARGLKVPLRVGPLQGADGGLVDMKDIESILAGAETGVGEVKMLGMIPNMTMSSLRKRPYGECPICKTLLHKLELKAHLNEAHRVVVAAPMSYKCELCEKEFSRRPLLQRHVKSFHERIVIAECETCGKEFTDRSNYKQHLLIHTGVRGFMCQVCGKSFVQAQGLRMHMPAHAEVSPYFCGMCSKRFRWKQHYEVHVSRHYGKKTHQCETCGKFFSSKYELKMHSWIHKEEWPYICKLCGKGFNQAYGMKTHMRNRHSLRE